MSIVYHGESRSFCLSTRSSSYQLQIGPENYLLHLYYGPRCDDVADYLHLPRDCGFSPNPYDLREGRGFSLDTQPQEYSGANGGDFRLSSVELETDAGLVGADLHVIDWERRPGKYSLRGLPAAYVGDEPCETLSILLRDEATGLEVELLYGVLEARDVITRAARIRNGGSLGLTLHKAASACLDLPFGDWDLIRFHGRHTMERVPERSAVCHGLQSVYSQRGASSHQLNPFTILCEHRADEDHGLCYGLMPVYSGGHRTDVERDQGGSVRAVTGIEHGRFAWRLEPGQVFDTPEVIFAFSESGLTTLSHVLHRFLRENVSRHEAQRERSGVLLNSWEANYFSFTEDSIVRLAESAKAIGAELLVLDDGWFGERDDDHRALGDWFVNTRKLPGGLSGLIQKVRALGLDFGLWIEPEMVNEDSALYRAHPDWALRVPGRKPAISRDQLVLDLSRPEVVDWLYDTFAAILRENEISYIKWDMNRHLSDLYSPSLPAGRQGELAHRYVLGLYRLLDRLTSDFPEVLFEGCAGGGGRFDAGILAYCPQIWCSDNSDPIARLSIQQGTSYGYPVSAMGAHVSASPNHQTGRSTPLGTRGVVAMAGSFGYELDPAKLSDEEKAEIREQIAFFHAHRALLQKGLFYRLTEIGGAFTAWEFVSEDGAEALLSVVMREVSGNPVPLHVCLKGLDPEAVYRLEARDFFGCRFPIPEARRLEFTGALLMHAGYTLPQLLGDYPSARLLFVRKD